MAKKNEPEVTEQKVQTRYDKKMAARKAKEERDRRDEKIFKTVTAVIGIAIVLAIVIGFGSSIVKKQTALHGTYIQVGEENISKLEFDYYYHSVVNSYLSTYGSIASYMGLDTSKDPAEQIYENVWQETADYTVENTVMVHIRHIREKVEIDAKKPRYVKVVWGIGYKMEKYDKSN